MINVTKSFLPPLEEYTRYLQGIWERGHLTNHGPLSNELEEKLKEYLGVKHLFLLNNGTIALQIAIKALDLHGDIITTPFSYVATTSSIVWENARPVFVDIDPAGFTIDAAKIEQAITPHTTAILATHVYGNPCDVDAIEDTARKHGLKVIYDAAHAFGVKKGGRSVLGYGDISTLSFHATKIFHTVEGGAIVTNDDDLAHRVSYMRNFGHRGQEAFWGLGINGKNSEFHAAMGLCNLNYIDSILSERNRCVDLYDRSLEGVDVEKLAFGQDVTWNYAYYPVVFRDEADLIAVRDALNAVYIYPRRYFYPSLTTLDYVDPSHCPLSESISRRVLCLPLYPDLANEDIKRITDVIRGILKFSKR